MKTLLHSIEIEATPAAVWDVLTDQQRLSEWNPFLRSRTGELAVGRRIDVRIQPPAAKAMSFRPVVLEVTPGRRLRWLGRLGLPGIFDGEHDFQLEELPDGRTRFVQTERFSGVLVPFVRKMLRRTEEGFAAMNLALKERVEQNGVLAKSSSQAQG